MFLHPAIANIGARLGPIAATLLSTLISVRIQFTPSQKLHWFCLKTSCSSRETTCHNDKIRQKAESQDLRMERRKKNNLLCFLTQPQKQSVHKSYRKKVDYEPSHQDLTLRWL